MRVYYDTGTFIDYLSARGYPNALLRSSSRRGRTPDQIALDAERLFEKVSRNHLGATSALTYYEVEEALYRVLADPIKGVSRADMSLIPIARSIPVQVYTMIEDFNISVLSLTPEIVRLQLQQLDLQTRGVRAADALHAASAIMFDADLLVSTDESLLRLDGVLHNGRARRILCFDTDSAIKVL